MNPPQTLSPWEVLLAELAAGAGLAHLLDGWPPATVGFLSALIVGTTIFTAGTVERWVIGDAIGPGERFTGRLADERVYTTAKDAAWWAETYARGVGAYEGQ